ncbi:MAG: UDP-N-acetylmuramate dehydrogenase [Gammaproteobacteria bacterium]
MPHSPDPTMQLRGTLHLHEPMAKHTSWRVGGPAERFYVPADLDDLVRYLQQLPPEEPLFWLGLGSNLLVRDGGIKGTVIQTFGALARHEFLEQQRLRVEAGVACAKVARLSAKRGLTGAEFLAGIPGTIGGALAMNAGAFAGETWTHVERLETLDRQGTLRVRQRDEYHVEYRSVCGPQREWFVAAYLKLERDSGAETGQRIKELLAERLAKQPIQQASCGSVFRNPPGGSAARLIEETGLKGLRIGGAFVSEKHANFFINGGDASAADIEALIDRVALAVEAKQGVRLIPEVRIVGDQSTQLEHASDG